MTYYLLRFDDICPTMRWSVWNEIEAVLERYNVQPLLAVVPDNQDPYLMVEPARPDFWEWVRRKQAQGWAIGLHGYQHRYETEESGLLGINARSEFAGLPLSVQKEKLCRALAIFAAQGVHADAFVAPAHSFDWYTVQVLHEAGIRVISDGFSWRPYCERGLVWIPQQLWRLRSMPCGFWTVCYHPNGMDARAVAQLERAVRVHRPRIVGLETALSLAEGVPARWGDRAFSACWRTLIRARQSLRRALRGGRSVAYA